MGCDTAASKAEAIMVDYEAGLDEPYIAYSGTAVSPITPTICASMGHASGSNSSARAVWSIRRKFICHTIWRDSETDYGAVYGF